jgi:cytochrome c oxidase assembly protein subunit 15
MVFFCLMTVIAIRTRSHGDVEAVDSPKPYAPYSGGHREPASVKESVAPRLAGLRPWAGFLALATFGQIVLGGIVRHTASGLACFGVPLCNGELWPSHPGAHWHMSHRIFALLLGTCVFALGATVRARAPGSTVARLATLAMGLVVAQVALGVLSVLSMLALSAVTLHLGVAALLFACNVAIVYYLPKPAPAKRESAAYSLPLGGKMA